MSKLNNNKINFNSSDFVVEVKNADYSNFSDESVQQEQPEDKINDEAQQIIEEAEAKAQQIIEEADLKAQEIINSTQKKAQQDADELINNSKEQIEKETTEATKKGYDDGYKDADEKIHEELSEKIKNLDNFCNIQYEIKDKIIKSASKDILNLIFNITKKILIAEVNGEIIDKIIQKTISTLEKKENITILLSEKYAKLLFELQKKSLNDGCELTFEDFKQYDNFDVIYNAKFDDDTIIVENPKERLDASLLSQLDIIIRDVYKYSQNGKIDLGQDCENETERTE